MRRPRDYDAELKALSDKAQTLRARKLVQLGELVVATQADTLPIEQLAGLLLAASAADAVTQEAWARRGAGFFRERGAVAGGAAADARQSEPRDRAAPPPAAAARPA